VEQWLGVVGRHLEQGEELMTEEMEEVLVRLGPRLHRLLPVATQALRRVAAEELRPEAQELLQQAAELIQAGQLQEARLLLGQYDPALAEALQEARLALQELAPVVAEAARLLGEQRHP
jgi:hypothetical protein